MLSRELTSEYGDVLNASSLESESQLYEPTIYYTISEVLVAIFAVVGNSLVITVFCKERRLRRRTNYYIVSLAAADLLVGLLGIPFALLASIGLPTNLHACLFTVSLLVVLCTTSIFCLVAVSIDRYWAILHPMGYSRHVRTKTALVIISVCWLAGFFIGFLPLMGWHQNVPSNVQCYFLKVMDHSYLVFLYIVTIITPALLLAAFYAHIYRVVLKQLRQIVTMKPGNTFTTSGTMLRMLGDSRQREVKATQNLSIIVLFFMICWIPLYTMNFILTFCASCFEVNSTVLLFCVILSHLNSAGNPLLYAYHLKDFRAALQLFFYRLFGYTERAPLTPKLNGRYSLGGSSNAGLSNYYNRCRLSSMRESRSALAISRDMSGSRQMLSEQLRHNLSRSLPATNRVSTIVPQAAILAAVPTGENNVREIWKISENPSFAEDHSNTDCEKKYFVNGVDNSRFHSIGNEDVSDEEDNLYLEYSIAKEPPNRTRLKTSLSNISVQLSSQMDARRSKHKSACISLSSPQLTRDIFTIDVDTHENTKRYLRSTSLMEEQTQMTDQSSKNKCESNSAECSPFKVVGDILYNRNRINSSTISDVSLHKISDVVCDQHSRNNNALSLKDCIT